MEEARGSERAARGPLTTAARSPDDHHISTNMIASCCGSLLLVDSPKYRTNIVLMFPEFTRHSADIPPTLARTNAQDWPEDRLSALPPKANIFNSSDGSRRVEPEGHADGLAAIERRQTLSDTDVEPREGETTFQRLLEDAGGVVACLDLPEHPHSFRLRS